MNKEKRFNQSISVADYTLNNGGSIYIPTGINMEHGDADFTLSHEMCHAYFSYATNIGMLHHLAVIGKSLDNSNHYNRLIDCLYGLAREIQEIFANGMELVYAEKSGGIAKRNDLYEKKTDEYKSYSDETRVIWGDSSLTPEEKQDKIAHACIYAGNIDVLSYEGLDTFVEKEDEISKTIKKRFYLAIRGEVKNDDSYSLESVIGIAKKWFPNAEKILAESFDYAQTVVKTGNNSSSILKKIRTFDTSRMYFRKSDKFDWDASETCIVKAQPSSGDVSWIAIQYNQYRGENKAYYCKDHEEKRKIENGLKHVAVLCEDYDRRDDTSQLLTDFEGVLYVIYSDYDEYKTWLSSTKEFEEIYVGDLSPNETDDNLFTIIFARKRGNDKVIHAFPTVSLVAHKIYEETPIQYVRYSGSGMSFWDIFSGFNGIDLAMKSLGGITSFLSQSEGNIFNHEANKSSSLIKVPISFGLDELFKIRPKDYYKNHALFPTMETKAEPFWVIMEFSEEDGNTGNIVCGKDAQTNVPLMLIFESKKEGESYLSNNPMEKTNRVVGMDKVYWGLIKDKLRKGDIRLAMASKSIAFDVDRIDYYITQYGS